MSNPQRRPAVPWNYQTESNFRALAILRVSSGRQPGGVSHNTQDSEITKYCKDHDLDLVETRKIVESAKRSIDRKKYNAAIAIVCQARVCQARVCRAGEAGSVDCEAAEVHS